MSTTTVLAGALLVVLIALLFAAVSFGQQFGGSAQVLIP